MTILNTPGHLSLAVHTDAGLEIIAGQVRFTCAEFQAGTPSPADMHTTDWHHTGLESLRRLHALRPDRAHFSHDAATYTPL